MRNEIKMLSVLTAMAGVLLAGCEQASLTVANGTGPKPVLPVPKDTLLPTLNIAPAQIWKDDAKPVAAAGLKVVAFASGLDHPRWLAVLPNGDVLVAESNGPDRPDDSRGLRGWVTQQAQKRAGAGTPSANRITLLRDTDGDGVADVKTAFIEGAASGLHSPFGMALVGSALYVANTDALLRFDYLNGDTHLTAPGVKVADLPGGTLNHHWTKNVIASGDGQRLYVTVGSNSNVAEHGIAAEAGRAAIIEIDPATGKSRPCATGLRNPNGMGWEPQTGALWTAVNERDEIGSDLVPDYMTEVVDGAFYGWPYSYYGQHVDIRTPDTRPDLVATARVPDYALGPHTASLGLAFDVGSKLPAPYSGGVFIGQHGSWNRRPFSGYKVIFVRFASGKPVGEPVDVLTGFVDRDGRAQGRPVGVAIDGRGGLLVADDVGNRVWRVTGQ